MGGAGQKGDLRSDEALLAAIALGDDLAGLSFVRRYQARVFGLAFTILRDASLAEEVAQEALLRAWRHASVYDARRGSVTGWLLTITRNLAVDSLRVRRPMSLDPDELAALTITSTDEGPEEMAELEDSSSRVRLALQHLSPDQCRAVLLAAFYGLTAREIAEREEIPLGTAKTRVRSGLLKLRRSLAVAPLPPGGPGRGEASADA
jgi:RNA polymerase sigma factor (sigma-70 family)